MGQVNTELTSIQSTTWNWIEQEQLNPNTAECRTSFEDVINACLNSSSIGRYQWNYQKLGSLVCLLHEIFERFKRELPILSPMTASFVRNYHLAELRQRFDEIFNDLWSSLTAPNFSFIIIIPTFGINFMTRYEPIVLDSQHRIIPKELMQGTWIPDQISRPPTFWGAYNLTRGQNNTAPGYFELQTEIPKRLNGEDPYLQSPLDLSSANVSRMYGSKFDPDILKIWIFTRLYFSHEETYLSFGDSYNIQSPHFCSNYGRDLFFCLAQFPQVGSSLLLHTNDQRSQLTDIWQSLFSHFSTFYDRPGSEKVPRFALEALRSIPNIPYPEVRLVLHVFALEHLLYIKKVEKDLDQKRSQGLLPPELQGRLVESAGHKWPVAWVFYRLSRHFNESWESFTAGNAFEEILDFIITAFNYRNEIAHRKSKMNSIAVFLPNRLYQEPNLVDRIGELFFLVDRWFPRFLTFILRFFYMMQPVNSQEWDDFQLGCL